jgi:hypothetical protein
MFSPEMPSVKLDLLVPINGKFSELRSAQRFPLKLAVAVHDSRKELTAETSDISACGALFRTDADLQIGSTVEFTITFPAEVLALTNAVRVHCTGRVVRSDVQQAKRAVAVMIDEYNFERE